MIVITRKQHERQGNFTQSTTRPKYTGCFYTAHYCEVTKDGMKLKHLIKCVDMAIRDTIEIHKLARPGKTMDIPTHLLIARHHIEREGYGYMLGKHTDPSPLTFEQIIETVKTGRIDKVAR